MKILAISDNNSFLHHLLSDWRKNHDVSLYSFRNKPKALIRLPSFYRSVKKADLIYIEWMAASARWFLNFFLKKTPIHNLAPIIIRCHGFEITSKYLSKMDVSKVFKVICVSKTYEQILLDEKPELNGRSTVIYNGVDISKFNYTEAKPFNHETVMIGSHNQNKRFFDVVSSWHPFKSTLHLVGGFNGSPEEEAYAWTQKYIEKFGVNAIIHGFIDHDQLPIFLKNKSFLINNSLRESFGVSIVEAMASGVIPLVFQGMGATHEIVPRELLFKDSTELRKLLDHFFSCSKEQIREWRARVRHITETKFCIERNIKEFQKLFEEVTCEKKAAVVE